MTNDSRSDNKSSKVNSGNFSEAYSKDYTEEQQKKLNSPNEIRLKANKQLEKSTSNTDCYWSVHNENWG